MLNLFKRRRIAAELAQARKREQDRAKQYKDACKARDGVSVAHMKHVKAQCKVLRLELKLGLVG